MISSDNDLSSGAIAGAAQALNVLLHWTESDSAHKASDDCSMFHLGPISVLASDEYVNMLADCGKKVMHYALQGGEGFASFPGTAERMFGENEFHAASFERIAQKQKKESSETEAKQGASVDLGSAERTGSESWANGQADRARYKDKEGEHSDFGHVEVAENYGSDGGAERLSKAANNEKDVNGSGHSLAAGKTECVCTHFPGYSKQTQALHFAEVSVVYFAVHCSGFLDFSSRTFLGCSCSRAFDWSIYVSFWSSCCCTVLTFFLAEICL